jgi:membrane-bound serine protease (ClpP class)
LSLGILFASGGVVFKRHGGVIGFGRLGHSFDQGTAGYAVSLPLILALSLASAGFFLFVVGAAVKAHKRPVVSGREELLHARGEVLDDFAGKGRIRIHGEVWQAATKVPLRRGDRVRVTAVDGLVLSVEPETKEE